MKTETVQTYTVLLKMAGDIEHAKRLLRTECYPPNEGLCMTVEPTTFIYTGGGEAGFVVGFVNYPRFPTELDKLLARVKAIAERLITGLCQWSALLIAPDRTEWLNGRPEGQR